MTRLTEAVRNAFSTSEYPIGPFAFFRPEQRALGKIVMFRFEGQYGVELDTMPLYEFKNRLGSPPLSESESVRESLEALRNAEDARTLVGRERLADVQNHLVDLLAHQEARLGFSVFSGERKKCLSFQEPSVLVDPESGTMPHLAYVPQE
jgi:hypothetical protein